MMAIAPSKCDGCSRWINHNHNEIGYHSKRGKYYCSDCAIKKHVGIRLVRKA